MAEESLGSASSIAALDHQKHQQLAENWIRRQSAWRPSSSTSGLWRAGRRNGWVPKPLERWEYCGGGPFGSPVVGWKMDFGGAAYAQSVSSLSPAVRRNIGLPPNGASGRTIRFGGKRRLSTNWPVSERGSAARKIAMRH